MDWQQIASDETILQTIKSLGLVGIEAEVLENVTEAKTRVEELVPAGAEVMTMSSQTLETSGITALVNDSGKYTSVKNKLSTMDRATQGSQMQKLGAAPTWAIGSVHAVAADGHVVIASNTGSQLGAYAYGSEHVIWVVGAQKIVSNLDMAIKRVYEYVLGRESERVQKANGWPGSNVSKMLIVNKETHPGRIKMLIVKEVVGF